VVVSAVDFAQIGDGYRPVPYCLLCSRCLRIKAPLSDRSVTATDRERYAEGQRDCSEVAMANGSRAKSRPSRNRMSVSRKMSPSAAAEPEWREIDADVRHRMIACAAYYRAEQRGFSEDGAFEDWLAAEREVNALLQMPMVDQA